MSHIEITREVWIAEEHIAEGYRATHDDHLPETPFWLLVNQHYLEAVETGHLARFEHWHGKLVTCWEEQDHAPSAPIALPVMPVEITSPVAPVTSPVVPVEPVLPGSSGTGSGVVPEPSSVLLLGLGVSMLWVWLVFSLRRYKRRYDMSDYCDPR